MTRMTEIRTRGFRRALTAGALGAMALGAAAMATPALADGYYYYQSGPVYTYTPAPTTTTTYTYTSPSYTYVEPAPPPVVYRERGPGVYLDTPIINFGVGFH